MSTELSKQEHGGIVAKLVTQLLFVKYWSFRDSDRKCFLMKSCCRTDGDKAYQSGDNSCP